VRVAIVCPYALDVPGGVQGQSLGLAGALARRGHEVALLAPGAAGARGGAFPVVDLGATRAVPANGSVAPLALGLSVLSRTRGALGRFRPDVVHLEEPFVPLVGLAGLSVGAPLVGTFHRAGAGRGYRSLRPLLARLAARLDGRVAVSLAAAATLEAVTGRAPDEVLHNAVDPERFSAPPAAPTGGARRIAFVGRHEQRKGLEVLLRAFTGLEGDDLELLVVSDGPERARLERDCADPRVRWLGRIDDDALAALLGGAQLFAAPSLGGESFGVVLLEAMAAGCAVVASDLPGYREAGGESACYVAPGDPEALRQGLARLLAEPELVRRLGAAGRARAAEHSFSALAAAYESCYERALGRGRAR